MKKTVLGYCLFAVVSLISLAPQAGDELTLKEGHPQTHVVVKGDTLWDISKMFLNDPWLWPEIWHVNPQVDNPHLIYPGDVLNLVYIDGKPKLVVKRNKDVKLTPKVRISELDLAIPAIPLDAISPFLSQSRVVSKERLQDAPYVLAGNDGHIVSGAGDQLFARGEFDPEGDKNFGIFRPSDAYMDPDTDELLGYQALSIASAKVIDIEEDIATMGLNRTSEEVRRGDRLLPDEERRISSNFYPSAPEEETEGYIISVEGGVSQIGSMNVVVINRGEREGMEVGHVLAIYRVGEQVRDSITGEIVKVPDSRAGLMMIFRTFEKVSYGLVLKATRPLAVMDKVKNP
ncbi:LysM peptidoglycan-binding domain-containing protein [Oceanicoccus sagamiensis]|uniref:Peptidoglycan-binding protein n=1 Tax=Oceanicoccus sagamiensis TaxID=716816 RepID=A0A1X9N7J6_9GAMM|nr:LysM peptidoglycan-binding domain-containing protein [Oceanicoccus sagamiensis]ARN74048.1 peptidoglycan-binding protein [Oceanicoccus sagamiensis]